MSDHLSKLDGHAWGARTKRGHSEIVGHLYAEKSFDEGGVSLCGYAVALPGELVFVAPRRCVHCQDKELMRITGRSRPRDARVTMKRRLAGKSDRREWKKSVAA